MITKTDFVAVRDLLHADLMTATGYGLSDAMAHGFDVFEFAVAEVPGRLDLAATIRADPTAIHVKLWAEGSDQEVSYEPASPDEQIAQWRWFCRNPAAMLADAVELVEGMSREAA